MLFVDCLLFRGDNIQKRDVAANFQKQIKVCVSGCMEWN